MLVCAHTQEIFRNEFPLDKPQRSDRLSSCYTTDAVLRGAALCIFLLFSFALEWVKVRGCSAVEGKHNILRPIFVCAILRQGGARRGGRVSEEGGGAAGNAPPSLPNPTLLPLLPSSLLPSASIFPFSPFLSSSFPSPSLPRTHLGKIWTYFDAVCWVSHASCPS